MFLAFILLCFSPSCFQLLCFLPYFTVLVCQFLISSVSSWGPARLGVVSGLAAGGAVPWTAPAWVTRGLCTLVWGLLSARVGVVSVAVLPAALDQDLSQCGWPPKGSFLHATGLAARPCLFSDSYCMGECEYVCLRAYVCVCLCQSLCKDKV